MSLSPDQQEFVDRATFFHDCGQPYVYLSDEEEEIAAHLEPLGLGHIANGGPFRTFHISSDGMAQANQN